MYDIDVILDMNKISNSKDWRYGQKYCTVIKNGVVKKYNFIILENHLTHESIISEFQSFFYDKNRINSSLYTKINNYGTHIIPFLNYIFFDSTTPVKSIEDITVKLGESFLNKYIYGELSKFSKKEKVVKCDDVIDRANYALTVFYSWLYHSEKYNLKNINENIFTYRTVNYHKVDTISDNSGNITKNVLEPIFNIEYPHKPKKKKLESPDEFMIYNLIEVARQYDPMMAFPIALQAFAGLRCGEVCQICKKRITNRKLGIISTSFAINLQEEYMLRDDGVITGEIKIHRIQLVYEAFLPKIDELYIEHMKILREKELIDNNYGALIFNNRREAMTTHTYMIRFKNLVVKLTERLGNLEKMGDKVAATDFEILSEETLTPHKLRYFFSAYVGIRENSHLLAVYRGDGSLRSALTYLNKSGKSREYIRKLQDSFIESYEKNLRKG